jgi:L-alanine-DL-glutamate epimerase-like enolase superfamily enzyme
MKITAVRATCVALPYRRPEIWADGMRPGVNNVIVEIETDAGIVGWGEATCGSGNSADPTREVIVAFAPYLIGEDPRAINRHIDRFYTLARWRLWRVFTNTALAAIESALWDIKGKALGEPVSELIGGRLRDRIPVFGYLMHDTPEAMATEAARLAKSGFKVLYFKVGLSEEEDDRTVRAVREGAGPKARLRIDVNETWDVATAVRRIEDLHARYRLDFVEQPLPGSDMFGMAELRRRVRVPIAVNQSSWTLEDVLACVRHGAGDVVVAGLHWLGGILAMVKAGAICQAATIAFCRHSSGEMGIAAAAGFHAMATMPLIDDGSQTYFSHWPHDIVEGDAMAIVDGCQPVPSAPGLGIAVDRRRVEEFAALYRREGPYVTRRA